MIPSLILITLFLQANGTSPSESDHTTAKAEAIFERWRNRERQLQAVTISWNQSGTSPWTAMSHQELTTGTSCECSAEVAGAQICFRLKNPPRHGLWSTIDQTSIEGTNAGFTRVLNERFRREQSPASGLILVERFFSEGELLSCLKDVRGKVRKGVKTNARDILVTDGVDSPDRWIHPLVLAIRPDQFHQQVVAGDHFLVTEDLNQSGDRKLISLTETRSADHLQVVYWLDPERDFVVRRCRVALKGELSEQIDLDYELEAGTWLPSSWNLITRAVLNEIPQRFPGQDKLFENSQGVVSNIDQPSTPPQISDPILPAGAIFVDLGTKSAFRVGPGGEIQGRLTAAELLSESETPGRQNEIPWYNIAIVTGIVFLMLLLIIRRRRSKNNPNGIPQIESDSASHG